MIIPAISHFVKCLFFAYNKHLSDHPKTKDSVMTAPHPDTIILTADDLPLYCNGKNAHTESWNGHPRVFLPIQGNGSVECPYCGTVYHLDGDLPHHHAPH